MSGAKDPILGMTLGGYYIDKPLGMGGMATVYRGYDERMDRYAAIKVLPSHYSNSNQFSIRFEREAKSIARLEHLHILPIYAFDEEEGITFIAMRYLTGGTLTKKIRKNNGLDFSTVATILHQVGGALDYAHSKGVIHRDVKPSNILLDHQDNAFLTDFGIAKMFEDSGVSLTVSGGVIGTPKYMSPEQCRGEKNLTPSADLYSLGIVVYEMITGDVPFEADTPLALIQRHLNDPLPLPSLVRDDLPPATETVVLKALAKNPEERYANCLDFATAFTKSLQEHQDITLTSEPSVYDKSAEALTMQPPTITTPEPTKILSELQPKPSRSPMMLVVFIIAIIFGIGGVLFASGLFNSEPSSSDAKSSYLFSHEDTDLDKLEFEESSRFWETQKLDDTTRYRTSGSLAENLVVIGESSWQDYQLTMRFQSLVTYSEETFYPFVYFRLNPAQSTYYNIGYLQSDDAAQLLVYRHENCSLDTDNECEIIANLEVSIIDLNTMYQIVITGNEDTISLQWITSEENYSVQFQDDSVLDGSNIGIVIPEGQVFTIETLHVAQAPDTMPTVE